MLYVRVKCKMLNACVLVNVIVRHAYKALSEQRRAVWKLRHFPRMLPRKQEDRQELKKTP